MGNSVWPVLITALFGSGVISAIIMWLKDRKKDSAAVALTDVQTLQERLAYLDKVYELQKRINEDLQTQVMEGEAARQRLRSRVMELELELDTVRTNAAALNVQCRTLSAQCDDLSSQLKELLHNDADQ